MARTEEPREPGCTHDTSVKVRRCPSTRPEFEIYSDRRTGPRWPMGCGSGSGEDCVGRGVRRRYGTHTPDPGGGRRVTRLPLPRPARGWAPSPRRNPRSGRGHKGGENLLLWGPGVGPSRFLGIRQDISHRRPDRRPDEKGPRYLLTSR